MKLRPNRSLTIRDVARLAGVSVATVSAVLNKKGTTSPEMNRRVEVAIEALNYRPDNMARSLKTGKSKVIGMLVPDVRNPFFTEVMCGVEEMARSKGYSVILGNSNEDSAQEEENMGVFHSQRVDGVLLACAAPHRDYDRTAQRRFPIVFFDRLPSLQFQGPAVIVDNAGAAYEGTKHLIALGHKRIAIVAGRTDLSTGRDRVAGYRKAMQEAHLVVRESYFREGDFLPESGHAMGVALMRLAEPPTAIFSCNNSMTLGIMKALAESNISCPKDVSILTFDDFPWASYFEPQMTALAQPAIEMGREAMRKLLAILEPNGAGAHDLGSGVTILKAELRIRQSTARISSQ